MSKYVIEEFPNVTKDFISDLKYIPENNIVLVSSWDGTLSVYEIIIKDDSYKITLNKKIDTGFSILSCCYGNNGVYLGGVHGELYFLNLKTQDLAEIKNNRAKSGIVRIIPYYDDYIAGSWDGYLQIIDHHLQDIKLFKTIENGKILTMDCTNEHLVVCLTGNKIKLFKAPITQMNEGILVDSVLKYQTRDIKLIPDGSGYVIGSIDGRVAVEYFDNPSDQFAFRCHRMKLSDVQFVFPVNTLLFKPNTDILFTGGSDGCVSCWSLRDRRKLKQYNKLDENSVVKMAGGESFLLVATSDDSFKTNAIISSDFEPQPSNVYLIVLNQ
ncbi:Bub3p PWA37_003994 [Arxiozyma heterogenica]|uniref:Mitotic checkpoint protein BUB3 n=1 Tax=Arxiozyma heterogenica TaxID=278026 RepID=A0AAN7WMT8_9SACH|nr:hypothetical protein RI543_003027 [Kazachstania heterogenica]